MGIIFFIVGAVLTTLFLIALAIEKKTGRARNLYSQNSYKAGVLIASLIGPILMMVGLFFWGLNTWIWLGILVVISFLGFLVAIWFVGSFTRIMKGTRIINAMIAIEIFGLFMMLLALIIFFAFSDSFAVADALLTFGLLCAIPAAIYLIAYLLLMMSEKNAPLRDNQRLDIYYNPNLEAETPPQPEIQPEPEPQPEPQAVIIPVEVEQQEEQPEIIEEELDDHKKQIEEELKVTKKELESVLVTGTGNAELEAKIAELEQALGRVDELENERKKNLLLAQAKRKEKAEEKKRILSEENIMNKIRKYFTEVAACFMTNHDTYKDTYGVSPYNKLVVQKNPDGTQKVTHTMSTTTSNLFKFSEHLVDLETFIAHPQLMPMFNQLVAEGTSLIRISEKLYISYMQFYKKDLIKDYKYKEDFENLLILVSHHFILKDVDFAQVFGDVKIPPTDTEAVVAYLADAQVRERFAAALPQWAALGFESIDQALVVAFHSANKNRITDDALKALITKDADKLAKAVEKQVKKNERDATKAAKAKPKPAPTEAVG